MSGRLHELLRAERDKCECGHERGAHPYVGRHASWPTRCYYCECLTFRLAEAGGVTLPRKANTE